LRLKNHAGYNRLGWIHAAKSTKVTGGKFKANVACLVERFEAAWLQQASSGFLRLRSGQAPRLRAIDSGIGKNNQALRSECHGEAVWCSISGKVAM